MVDRREEVRRQLDQFVPGERVLGGRSRRPSEARYFFEAPDLGVSFAWFGGHGVHVYDRSGKEIDLFSVGDFAKTDAMLEEIKRAVEERVREARGRFVREEPSKNIYWRDIKPGSKVELVGPPGSQSYLVDARLGAYWVGGESREARQALDKWASLGRRPPSEPMPEDISEVAGLGPLEHPRVGRSGIRSLRAAKALDMLEDAIVDGRRVASDYRQLARELEEIRFPIEANLVAAVRKRHLRDVQTLEEIRTVVGRRK